MSRRCGRDALTTQWRTSARSRGGCPPSANSASSVEEVSQVNFNHVTLIVSDLERSKSFYRTLGLTQIVDAPPRYARFIFPVGAATLSIEVKELDSPSRGG